MAAAEPTAQPPSSFDPEEVWAAEERVFAAAEAVAAARAEAEAAEAEAVDYAWEAYEAPNGRAYYHNAVTGVTTWKRPVQMDMLAPAVPPLTAADEVAKAEDRLRLAEPAAEAAAEAVVQEAEEEVAAAANGLHAESAHPSVGMAGDVIHRDRIVCRMAASSTPRAPSRTTPLSRPASSASRASSALSSGMPTRSASRPSSGLSGLLSSGRPAWRGPGSPTRAYRRTSPALPASGPAAMSARAKTTSSVPLSRTPGSAPGSAPSMRAPSTALSGRARAAGGRQPASVERMLPLQRVASARHHYGRSAVRAGREVPVVSILLRGSRAACQATQTDVTDHLMETPRWTPADTRTDLDAATHASTPTSAHVDAATSPSIGSSLSAHVVDAAHADAATSSVGSSLSSLATSPAPPMNLPLSSPREGARGVLHDNAEFAVPSPLLHALRDGYEPPSPLMWEERSTVSTDEATSSQLSSMVSSGDSGRPSLG